jgi:hypothetical protein
MERLENTCTLRPAQIMRGEKEMKANGKDE